MRLVVRAINGQPSLALVHSELVLFPALEIEAQVADNISTGQAHEDSQQLYSLSVIGVRPAGSDSDARDTDLMHLFEHLSITPQGCLKALLREEAPASLDVLSPAAWGGGAVTLQQ